MEFCCTYFITTISFELQLKLSLFYHYSQVISSIFFYILLAILSSTRHTKSQESSFTAQLHDCHPPPDSRIIKFNQTEYYEPHGGYDVPPFLRIGQAIDTYDGPSHMSILSEVGDDTHCPWRMVADRDIFRIPQVVARALCEPPAGLPTGMEGTCVPKMFRLMVLRQNGCLRGMDKYYPEYLDVETACVLQIQWD